MRRWAITCVPLLKTWVRLHECCAVEPLLTVQHCAAKLVFPKDMPPHDDAASSIKFGATRLFHVTCEPALICEEKVMLVADLPVLVLLSEWFRKPFIFIKCIY